MKGRAMSERERWAYEELQPGDLVQEGDQWLNPDGRWQAIALTPEASMEVGEVLRVRRPHSITALEKYRGDLIDDIQHVIGERDEARAEAERLSTARKSAQRARDELQLQVDELRADRTNEVTARQVQEVLRRWATELDWSVGCFGSFGQSQIDIIQQTMVAVIERIGSMIDPEATSADA